MSQDAELPAPGRSLAVKLPQGGMPGVAIAAIAAVCAVLLFFWLNDQRQEPQSSLIVKSDSSQIIASPPPLVLPRGAVVDQDFGPAERQGPLYRPTPARSRSMARISAPPRNADRQIAYSRLADQQTTEQPPEYYPRPPDIPRQTRSQKYPALVLDRGQLRPRPQEAAGSDDSGSSANRSDVLRPERIANQSTLIVSGTLIPAVLETPLDTSRGGLARAMTTKDSYSFDGRNVLIPKGSRLIGQYGSDVSPGQDRVLLTWERLVLPDGRLVRIASPSADERGAAGIPGKVHGNFIGRFVNSIFQTALNIATFRATRKVSGGTVIVGLPGATGSTTGLLPEDKFHRKITVPAGTEISVFVSQDIDFDDRPDVAEVTGE